MNSRLDHCAFSLGFPLLARRSCGFPFIHSLHKLSTARLQLYQAARNHSSLSPRCRDPLQIWLSGEVFFGLCERCLITNPVSTESVWCYLVLFLFGQKAGSTSAGGGGFQGPWARVILTALASGRPVLASFTPTGVCRVWTISGASEAVRVSGGVSRACLRGQLRSIEVHS